MTTIVGLDEVGPPTFPVQLHPASHAGMLPSAQPTFAPVSMPDDTHACRHNGILVTSTVGGPAKRIASKRVPRQPLGTNEHRGTLTRD